MKRFVPIYLSVFVLLVMGACRRGSDSTTPTTISCKLSSFTRSYAFNGPPATTLQTNYNLAYNDTTNFLITIQGTDLGQTYNVTLTYNTVNRQLSSISANGAVVRQPLYNVTGRLITQVNNNQDRSYEQLTYDGNSRLTAVRKFNQANQLIARRSIVYSGPGANPTADSLFTVNPATGAAQLTQAFFYTNYDANRNPLRVMGTTPYSSNLDITSMLSGCKPVADNNPGQITWLLPTAPAGSQSFTATPNYTYVTFSTVPTVASAASGNFLLGNNVVGTYSAGNTFGSGCQ